MDRKCSPEDSCTERKTSCMMHSSFGRESTNSLCLTDATAKAKDFHVSEGNLVKHVSGTESGPPLKKARYEILFKDTEISNQHWRTMVEEKSWSSDTGAGVNCGEGSSVSCVGMMFSASGQEDTQEPLVDTMQFPPDRCYLKESVHLPNSSLTDQADCETSPAHSQIAGQSLKFQHSSTSLNASHRPTLYSIRSENTDSGAESDDEKMDASNLVLSVIKTKVDIQTMKMCLRHNAEAFSSRSLDLPMSLPSIPSASSSVDPSLQLSISSPEHISSNSAPREGPVAGASRQYEAHQRYNSCNCNHTGCQTCRGERHHQLASPQDVPDVQVRGGGHLEHWQDQHTAKAIVDNAINRTIEEMVVAPDHPDSQMSRVNFDQEDDMPALQDQGLLSRAQQPIQSLQERLEPVINQLTQASELVFARNIEHSRSSSSHDRQIDTSPIENNVDQR